MKTGGKAGNEHPFPVMFSTILKIQLTFQANLSAANSFSLEICLVRKATQSQILKTVEQLRHLKGENNGNCIFSFFQNVF